MSIIEIILISIGLAMDAFAVAICKGLATKQLKIKHLLIVGLWFGFFQALMPLLGYCLGINFESYITQVDHWLAFALLSCIGGKMIYDSFNNKDEEADSSLAFLTMLVLAIATSIDALAVGITLAFLQVNIYLSIFFIGVITFILSMVGMKIGNVFGEKYKSKAELLGGIILVLIGIKVLIEHLFF